MRADVIKFEVSAYYRISPTLMIKKDRHRHISRPRQVAMYLCKKHTNMNAYGIAVLFVRDHSSVLHGISLITDLLKTSEELREDIEIIERNFPWIKNA